MDTDDRLNQIEKIAQNARTTWFGLLALLVFVSVTLMGHKDSDFFAYGATTQLPVVNTKVPPTAFFIASPVLTAALYIYLHIYLNGLWVQLSKAPPRIGGGPLEERIYPSMLATSALILRGWLRRDEASPVEGRGLATLSISLAMTWVFGLVVLGWMWARSWPLHDEWLTFWIGLWYWLAAVAAIGSFIHLFMTMRDVDWQPSFRPLWFGAQALACVLVLFGVSGFGWLKTEGGLEWYWEEYEWEGDPWFTTAQTAPFVPLSRAKLAEEHLTARPAEWPDFDDWKKEYTLTFRKRYGLDPDPSNWADARKAELESEIPERWQSLSRSLDKIRLLDADLRQAEASFSYFVGADLRGARMEGANFIFARLEGADLRGAQMKGVKLRGAWMQGADLKTANLQGAEFRFAKLQRADLIAADLKGADLRDARLQAARLSFVGTESKVIRVTNLQATTFKEAHLRKAFFLYARMHGSDLRNVDARGAQFWRAKMHAVDLRRAQLIGANFSEAELHGANLSFLDMSEADCSKTSFFASVVIATNLTCLTGPSAQGYLELAVGDSRTVLPDGVYVWSCLDPEHPEVKPRLEEISQAIGHERSSVNDQLGSDHELLRGLLFCDPTSRSELRRTMQRIPSRGSVN